MATNNRPKVVLELTAPGIITFPNLAEARQVLGKGVAKFSVNFEFSPDHVDIDAIKVALAKAAAEGFPGRDFATLKFPLESGDQLADRAKLRGKDREFSRGKLVLKARSQFAPALAALINGKAVDLDLNDKATIQRVIYSGVEAFAKFQFTTYENPEKDGVNAYVEEVFSLNRGTRLAGSARSAADTFKAYAGVASAVDPTGGAAGGGGIPGI